MTNNMMIAFNWAHAMLTIGHNVVSPQFYEPFSRSERRMLRDTLIASGLSVTDVGPYGAVIRKR